MSFDKLLVVFRLFTVTVCCLYCRLCVIFRLEKTQSHNQNLQRLARAPLHRLSSDFVCVLKLLISNPNLFCVLSRNRDFERRPDLGAMVVRDT